MKLKTIHAHDNEYGARYHKPVGHEYDVADEREAQNLIREGYVEEVAAPAKGAKADAKS